ncbi:MAG: short-chain dehydrogenase [Planctomycetota bacterium]|nr:MAG: short-chain dehydrogenase [Planctomycetota bacterium]
MQLYGKVAVITGAASGIGRATCVAMMDLGIEAIAAVDRSSAVTDMCNTLNQEIGRSVLHPYIGDVTSDEFRKEVFSDLRRRFGAVHLCVPAAGITRDRLAVKYHKDNGGADLYPLKDFEEVMRINLIAPIYWAMETIATVAEDRGRKGLGKWEPAEGTQGGVVFIGSVSSLGNKGQVSYATAKAGLAGAQATLAKEAIFYGVRCNIIHPGYTDTPMVRALGEDLIRQVILPQTQLRRLLRPEEVADAICFLLRNSAVSGSLWVDAGWHPAA